MDESDQALLEVRSLPFYIIFLIKNAGTDPRQRCVGRAIANAEPANVSLQPVNTSLYVSSLLLIDQFSYSTLLDALRFSEWAMRRMVAMVKQLDAFRALPPSDQLLLLRTALVQLLILRGAMAFDPINEVWRLNGAQAKHPFMLNLSVIPPAEQHYQQHKK